MPRTFWRESRANDLHASRCERLLRLKRLRVDRQAVGDVAEAMMRVEVDRIVDRLNRPVAKDHVEAVRMGAAEGPAMRVVAGGVLPGPEGRAGISIVARGGRVGPTAPTRHVEIPTGIPREDVVEPPFHPHRGRS